MYIHSSYRYIKVGRLLSCTVTYFVLARVLHREMVPASWIVTRLVLLSSTSE